jgi:signal transduction histidine kinase
MNIEPTSASAPALHLMQNDMVQSVVHDLRTPMTVIKGYLQLLISGRLGEMPVEQKDLLQRSVGPLEDLILLTDNLIQSLSLQKDDVKLEPVWVDLDQLLAETIRFYQLPFQQRHMAIYRDGNTLGRQIHIDPFWFKRVLNNLVWNAYKFTPDGGHVSFHVEAVDGGLQVNLRDTGRGIPSDKLNTVFKKFKQSVPKSDSKGGCGLGLWISRQVMERHDGHITVESVEGRGSCFSLWLPSERIH